MPKPKKPVRSKQLHIPLDEDLAEQARRYVDAQNEQRTQRRQPRLTLAGLVRALLRIQTAPEDAEAMDGWRELPPGIEDELTRPSRH